MNMNFTIAQVAQKIEQGFPIETGDNPSLRLLHPGSACKHSRFDVDEQGRFVQCRDCNAYMDPFDALLIVASCERRLQREWDDLQEEKRMARRFYAEKKTLEAQRCRHTRTFDIGDGKQKCLRCDTVIPPKPLTAPTPPESEPRHPQ